MVKAISAKFFYVTVDHNGKETMRSRVINRLSIKSDNNGLLTLSEVYGNLKGEQYVAVEKLVTEIVR